MIGREIGEGVSHFDIRLLVSDKSVDPCIRDLDCNRICSRRECTRYIDAEGRMPHDSQILSVHHHVCQVIHISHIQPQTCSAMKPRLRHQECLRVLQGTVHDTTGAVVPQVSITE